MTKNFFLAASITISGFISAQNTKSATDSNIKLGAKAGYSLSSMKFSDNKIDPKSYFYAGLFAEKSISSNMALQAEVLYTQVGGSENYPSIQIINNNIVEGGNIELNYQLTQIQVPVSFKYYFVPNLSASAGMNVAFNISKKIKSDQEFNGSKSHDYEAAKGVNLFPFLGAEYKINDKFFVDARYNFNFISVSKESAFNTNIGIFQAGIGYRFK